MSVEPQKNVKGAGSALMVTTFVSLLWIATVWFLLLHSSACAATTPDSPFLARWVECRTSYDIGNFFSGAFAPLAFFWLAVAVVIQSWELRLQREELSLTRAEATETRKAIQAQAEESKKQAAYIGAQTRLLEAAEQARLEDRQTREFAAYLSKLAARIMDNEHAAMVEGAPISPSYGNPNHLFDLIQLNGIPRTSTPEEIIRLVAFRAKSRLSLFTKTINEGQGPFVAKRPEAFFLVLSSVNETFERYCALPPEAQTQAEALNLDSLRDTLLTYSQMVANLSNT